MTNEIAQALQNEDEPELLRLIDESQQLLLELKAEIFLRNQRFTEGWKLWENRRTRTTLIKANKDVPLWDGNDLNGRTLLVAGEQGIGDHIMWARYLPTVRKMGNVVVYVQLPYILDRLLGAVSDPAMLPPFDCWIPMGDLCCMDYAPIREQYITPIPAEVERIRKIVRATNFKVGLCWQGNPTHPGDKWRSIPFEKLESITHTPGCTFFSLQKGEVNKLVNLCNYTKDMADVAAAIANLDLVITVDTAIAHLAGAMGKRTWILIANPSDWRWGKPDNPTFWYPATEYFWQTEKWNTNPDPWTPVIQSVQDRLNHEASQST